jgi:hypothetical protein
MNNPTTPLLYAIVMFFTMMQVSAQEATLEIVSADQHLHIKWESAAKAIRKKVPQRPVTPIDIPTLTINTLFSKKVLHALGKPDRAFTDKGTFILEFQRIGLTLYMDEKRILQKAVIESPDAVIGETGERIGNVISMAQHGAKPCICRIKRDGFMELCFPESSIAYVIETRTRKIRAIELMAVVDRKKGNCDCPTTGKR